MKNIVVVFGGVSVEHDVSIITGVLTLNSLDREKFNPIPVYIDKEGRWWNGESLFDIDEYKKTDYKKLKRVTLTTGSNILYQIIGEKDNKKLKKIGAVSVAVNCLHGGGEGGSLSGLMQNCFIPVASPDVLSSAVAMDKGATKIFLKGLNIPYVQYIVCKSIPKTECYKKLNFPLIVKPISTGSSIGITTANDQKELNSAVSLALRYDNRVIVEEKLTGIMEINCGAYMDEEGEVVVSECEKPIGSSAILSFEDKYLSGDREFPANIDEDIANRIKKLTKKIYLALGFNGIIRIDFFVRGSEVLVNEINSVPGSLAYYLFSDTLKGYSKILTKIIRLAEINFARESSVIKEFSTNLLSISGTKGGKGKKEG